jgi:hypothetical protein
VEKPDWEIGFLQQKIVAGAITYLNVSECGDSEYVYDKIEIFNGFSSRASNVLHQKANRGTNPQNS